ncbi:unnamed protein product, partial [Mesorhabditis belari]|uniref:H15 domain-containing protein n=1 Tax=Mesorhabditis belari TaxID=2138241 RepID=A0AAF3EQR7_9BILA
MSVVAVQPAAAPAPAKAKAPAKPKKTKVAAAKGEKKVAEHPPYSTMIQASIKAMADRKGSSKAAILKHVLQNYRVGGDIKKVNARLCISLKKGADSGLFKRMNGAGASGSFRLGEKAVKKVAKKTLKKPVAKKISTGSPKKAVVKKTTKAKKPAAEKKAKTAASPKKAKTTKPKSPKKNQYQQPIAVSGYPVFPWGVGGIYGNSYRPNPSVVQPPNSGSQSGSTCPKGPYATFLSQQEQEGLHELVVEARKSGASEAQVKEYINRYMQAVLSEEKFEKFTEAMNNFNAARSTFRN